MAGINRNFSPKGSFFFFFFFFRVQTTGEEGNFLIKVTSLQLVQLLDICRRCCKFKDLNSLQRCRRLHQLISLIYGFLAELLKWKGEWELGQQRDLHPEQTKICFPWPSHWPRCEPSQGSPSHSHLQAGTRYESAALRGGFYSKITSNTSTSPDSGFTSSLDKAVARVVSFPRRSAQQVHAGRTSSTETRWPVTQPEFRSAFL